MNKYKLRKTQQFGNFKYDPGKYYANDKTDSGPVDANEALSSNEKQNQTTNKRSTFEDELEAPWNQYAWAEELRLRVSRSCSTKKSLDETATLA